MFDNLSRRGTERNLEWLRGQNNPKFHFVQGDIRDSAAIRDVVAATDYDLVFHTAAQVAVTTSVTDPRTDFEVNALGTFNVLRGGARQRPQTHRVFHFHEQSLRGDGRRKDCRAGRPLRL